MRHYIVAYVFAFVKRFLKLFHNYFIIFSCILTELIFCEIYAIFLDIRPFSLDESCFYRYNSITITSNCHFGVLPCLINPSIFPNKSTLPSAVFDVKICFPATLPYAKAAP